jgi:hypothetical protein
MSERYAYLSWRGKRKGSGGRSGITSPTKPVHMILKRMDGTVKENDASLCGMVVVGGRDWELVDEKPDERLCARCKKFSERYEHIKRRRGLVG